MFTQDEIKMLFDGLDAIESDLAKSRMIGDIFGMILSKNKEDGDAYLEKREQEELQKEGKKQLLKERIILLKAKLIQLKGKGLVSESVNISHFTKAI